MTKIKKYVIAYEDVGKEYYRIEDKEGYADSDSPIMTFNTKEEAQEFLNTLDSHEYDRWIELKEFDEDKFKEACLK